MPDDKNMPANNAPDQYAAEEKSSQRSFWQTLNPGYIIAGIASIATSYLSTHRNYHKILRENRINEDLVQLRRESFQRLNQCPSVAKDAVEEMAQIGRESVKYTYPANYKGKTYEQMSALFVDAEKDGIRGINKVFHDIAEERSAAMGIKSTWDIWRKALKPHHKADVILKVITVTSIALGAIYSFSRERGLASALNRQIAQNEEQQQGQRR